MNLPYSACNPRPLTYATSKGMMTRQELEDFQVLTELEKLAWDQVLPDMEGKITGYDIQRYKAVYRNMAKLLFHMFRYSVSLSNKTPDDCLLWINNAVKWQRLLEENIGVPFESAVYASVSSIGTIDGISNTAEIEPRT